MNELCVKRVVDGDNSAFFILYEYGQLHLPLMILDNTRFKMFIEQGARLIRENPGGGDFYVSSAKDHGK